MLEGVAMGGSAPPVDADIRLSIKNVARGLIGAVVDWGGGGGGHKWGGFFVCGHRYTHARARSTFLNLRNGEIT